MFQQHELVKKEKTILILLYLAFRKMRNRISELFEIKYPIIQAGMVWCSGWELASAVSNNGGLGLIGAGSMNPETLKIHIQKCKAATGNPFGVNVPLLYAHAKENIEIILEEKVPIVFSSAGNPATYTGYLKSKGVKVVHVIANEKFARKAIDAGVDALVAEGFEAGGHNGKEETTTLCLLPLIRNISGIPVIAAGGIASGKAMSAAFALGAEGVQIGSLFAISKESSAHENYKQKVIESKDGETMLTLKKQTPVRMLKNELYYQLQQAIDKGETDENILNILGRGRSRKGIFEGNLIEGELEIGQIASTLNEQESVKDIMENLVKEFNETNLHLSKMIW